MHVQIPAADQQIFAGAQRLIDRDLCNFTVDMLAAPLYLCVEIGQMNEVPTVSVPLRVMFFDTDCAGVVHNIAYLRFIETARTVLGEELGWKLADMGGATGVFPVVVRTEIDYRRPARLGDALVVKAWLSGVERSRFQVSFTIRKEDLSTDMVTCKQTMAVVKMPEGKPVRLPEEWCERFAELATSLRRGTCA